MSTEGFPSSGCPASVAARASELVRSAWEHAPTDLDPQDAGFCVHRRGVLLYADSVALRLFGVSMPSEIIGARLLELVEAPCRPAAGVLVGDICKSIGAAVPVVMTTAADIGPLRAHRAPIRDEELGLVFFAEGADPELFGSKGSIEMQKQDGHNRIARVLICDDEGRLAMLTAGLLEEYGFLPRTVELGQDALDVIQHGEGADVLLLDVNLTRGLSAADLLSALRVARSVPQVVLTSGLAEEDVPRELLDDALVAGYLPKPYSVEQLIEIVRGALDALDGGS